MFIREFYHNFYHQNVKQLECDQSPTSCPADFVNKLLGGMLMDIFSMNISTVKFSFKAIRMPEKLTILILFYSKSL